MRTHTVAIGIPVVKRALQVSTLALGLLALGTGQSRAVPMSDLLAGGSVTCGDKTFTNFRDFSSVASGGADAPTAAQVFISPDASNCSTLNPGPGILIQSAQWNVNSGESIDTAFSFDVIVDPASELSIHDVDLGLQSFALDNGHVGDIHVTESVVDQLNNNVADLLVDAATGPTADHHDLLGLFTFLSVHKDISLEGHVGGSASLSTLTQNFSEVPEPASLAVIGVGLFALGWIRRRRIA